MGIQERRFGTLFASFSEVFFKFARKPYVIHYQSGHQRRILSIAHLIGQWHGNQHPQSSAANLTTSLAQILSAHRQAVVAAVVPICLDLSPAAQSYLNGGSTTSSSGSFQLTSAQQQTITSILTKYKDAPYTQATFDSIQSDLDQAGLGATQLSQIDQAKSFNGTQLLINDLNGNYSSPTTDSATTSDSQEQSKANSYIQNIISQWKQISGQSSASGTASTVTPASLATSA